MNEGQWKQQIVKMFKESHKEGFSWSHEARFKSGFPDLLLVSRGRSLYMELKKFSKLPNDFWKSFDPIQLEIMRQMMTAGIRCVAVSRGGESVAMGNPTTLEMVIIPLDEFNKCIRDF